VPCCKAFDFSGVGHPVEFVLELPVGTSTPRFTVRIPREKSFRLACAPAEPSELAPGADSKREDSVLRRGNHVPYSCSHSIGVLFVMAFFLLVVHLLVAS
jgi:hypothetical protein